MKQIFLLSAIALLFGFTTLENTSQATKLHIHLAELADSTRLAELDQFWAELSRTVKEGDFEGYAATYHPDAVIIFASGKNKSSVPVSKALAGWEQGFADTKAGKIEASVDFRFSQRIGDETTAHETGIFNYTTYDLDGKPTASYPTHFEMLLVKRDGKWLGLMEYQKAPATAEDWAALE